MSSLPGFDFTPEELQQRVAEERPLRRGPLRPVALLLQSAHWDDSPWTRIVGTYSLTREINPERRYCYDLFVRPRRNLPVEQVRLPRASPLLLVPERPSCQAEGRDLPRGHRWEHDADHRSDCLRDQRPWCVNHQQWA